MEQGRGARGAQLVLRAEAPADRRAVHPGVAGSFHIHVAVAYVEHLGGLATPFLHHLEDRIRRGLAAHALLLPHRQRNPPAEIVARERLDVGIVLVGNDGLPHACLIQPLQQRLDAVIGRGGIVVVARVIALERLQGLLEGFLIAVRRRRQRAMDQLTHAIAHKTAHLFQRAFGIAAFPQGVVDRVGQILQRVEQRSVQVVNDRFIPFTHSQGPSPTFVTGMIPLVHALRNPVLQCQPFPSIAKMSALCYNGGTLLKGRRPAACASCAGLSGIWREGCC
jgi:hypothetical protein